MADGLTSVVQVPFAASASGSSQNVAPDILELGSYNLTVNPSLQATAGLFSPPSSGSFFASLTGFVAVATAGNLPTGPNPSASQTAASQAYASALQLVLRETPAEAYLKQLLSEDLKPPAATPVAAAPAAAPKITENAGGSVTQGGTLFIGTDTLSASANGTPNSSLVFNITGGPSNGYLSLAYAPNAPISSFTENDLTAGLVQYVQNGNNTSNDSFTFNVPNGSGNNTQGTYNIAVSPLTVNKPPTLVTDTGATVAEGGSVAITAAQLDATDADTKDSSLTYRITSAPTSGHLELSSHPGVAITKFTQANIDAGQVRYVHNGAEVQGDTASDNFTFSLSDGATKLSGNTFNITINSDHDAPTVTTNTGLTATEGGTATITTSSLSASDADTPDANLVYSVTSSPASGILQLASNPGVAVTSFTQADLAAGNVQYVHNGSEIYGNSAPDGFTFNLSDGTTTLSGNTFNITVNSDHDAPVLTANAGLTTSEGATATITTADLSASDTDTTNANLLYTVTSAPSSGTLQLASNPGTAITSFTQADLAAGNVQYVHNGSEIYGSSAPDGFSFNLSDGTTTLSGNRFNITVNSDFDPPALTANAGLTTSEGGTSTITTADLSASDADTTNANLLYTVTSSPSSGRLQLASNPGVAITLFTQADLAAGKVQYVHNGSEIFGSTAPDSFTFNLSDGTTTLSGNKFNITINSDFDPPVLTTNTGTTATALGGPVTITTAQLNATDDDTLASNLTFSVTGTPKHGFLDLSTNPSVHITSFTEAQLQAGIVQYTHSGLSLAADSFTFTLTDQTTTLAPATFNIKVNL